MTGRIFELLECLHISLKQLSAFDIVCAVFACMIYEKQHIYLTTNFKDFFKIFILKLFL